MEKYIPLEKRSKRAQKQYHAAQRGSWNGVSPVSRTVPDRTKYDRRRQKQAEHRSEPDGRPACFVFM